MKAAPWSCEVVPLTPRAASAVVIVRRDENGHWWPVFHTGYYPGDTSRRRICALSEDVREGDRFIRDEQAFDLYDRRPCGYHDAHTCFDFAYRPVRTER